MDEYEEAWGAYHEAFIKKKYECISKLETIKNNTSSNTYKKWLDQVMEFINEQKG